MGNNSSNIPHTNTHPLYQTPCRGRSMWGTGMMVFAVSLVGVRLRVVRGGARGHGSSSSTSRDRGKAGLVQREGAALGPIALGKVRTLFPQTVHV